MKRILLICLIILSVLTLYSEENYKQGMKYYENNDFDRARAYFKKYLEENPAGDLRKEAMLKIYQSYSFSKEEEKTSIAEMISQIYPFEKETEFMRIEMANHYINENEYFEAAKWLMEIVLFSDKGSKARDTAVERVKRYISTRLEPREIEFLLYNYPSKSFAPLMLFRLFGIYHEEGEYEKSEFFRKKLILDYPDSYYTKNFILELENTPQARSKVAILLPQTGDLSPYGESVRKGIVIASSEEDIDFVLFNTMSNAVAVTKLIDSIYNDGSFMAVIGPIGSSEAIAAGAYLYDSKSMPVLPPIVTDGDLLEFSEDIFLVNKTLIEQAKFTVDFLNKTGTVATAGIIYPDNSYGKTLADAFIEGIKKTDIELMFDFSYIPGTSDFTDRLTSVKEMNVDVIYLPVSAEDAILLSTQIAYHDIEARMIGSDTWYSDDLMRLARDYIEQAIVIKPKDIDRYSDEYINFKLKFMKKYNREPDRYSMLGYDTFKMLARIIRLGYNNRSKINRYLRSMDYYNGVSGQITFTGNREEFDVYQIIDSEFKKRR